MLQDRLRPDSEIEWADIAVYVSNATGEQVSKDTIRKGAYLYYKFCEGNFWNDSATLAAKPPQNKITSINADGSEVSELRTQIGDTDLHDTDFLLRLHGYDPKKFELVTAKASQWGSGDAPMHSSKITVKPKLTGIEEDDIRTWFDRLDRNYSLAVPVARSKFDGDKLLIIPISDLHFNMQATMFNSGNEYNCEIAEKMFFDIINDIMDETACYNFQKILFTIGGDQMDADSAANTTTKGTPQHCDKHYWDACEQMYAMTVKAVDILAERAPVDVVYVPGNHDKGTGFKLAKYVDAWFRNDPRVTVDYSPLPRHYYVFGKTLFVFTHDCDVKRLQKLIPDEARDVWSSIDFTEVFLQHLHSEALLFEENNMRVQRLPSPVARSVWTNDKGYRSARQCKSFVYDKNTGLKNVIYTVVS